MALPDSSALFFDSRLQAPKPKLVKKSKMAQPPTDEEHARRAKSGAPYAEVLKG